VQRKAGRTFWMTGAAAIAILAATAIFVVARRPSIPADAAATRMAQATLSEILVTDPSSVPQPVPPQRHGGACLPRIQRGAGWLDLCWEATQIVPDEDPSKDYYQLRMYGSHGGLRWVVLRSQLVGTPGDNVYDIWPDGIYQGACRLEQVSMLVPLDPVSPGDICGRTEAHLDFEHWSHDLVWTCEGCLVPEADTKGISLYAVIGTPEGTLPSWDLFADAGS
jgi:hypothetical protein